MSSPFKSLIKYVQGAVFLIPLMIKTSSSQLWAYPLAKMFLYFDILTWSSTLNLGPFSLESSFYSA